MGIASRELQHCNNCSTQSVMGIYVASQTIYKKLRVSFVNRNGNVVPSHPQSMQRQRCQTHLKRVQMHLKPLQTHLNNKWFCSAVMKMVVSDGNIPFVECNNRFAEYVLVSRRRLA